MADKIEDAKIIKIIIYCPHCNCPMEIVQLNCRIFRHGILRSNGTQIKDMDFSIDDPVEFITNFEKQSGVSGIVDLNDTYIETYATLMKKPMEDVDGDEQASVWFVNTDKNVKPSYDVNYDDKSYIVKFHNV
jgi:hypothetical protein